MYFPQIPGKVIIRFQISNARAPKARGGERERWESGWNGGEWEGKRNGEGRGGVRRRERKGTSEDNWKKWKWSGWKRKKKNMQTNGYTFR